ncbi:MAG: hypothetical protein RBT63_01690 [Bdellovibrionales bacterium]|jgi:hypothetical protein|nr:hypothetical protein [Bdellovibrionales bacterium]
MNHTAFASLAVIPALLLLQAFSANAQTTGSIKELSKRTRTMPKISDCRKHDLCDLKGARMIERKIKVLLPDEHSDFASYMTSHQLILNFDKASSIPRYGVVQFVKGCMFQSELQADGSVKNRFNYVHKHFGKHVLLRHDDWVVDSSHADPIATSFEGYGRFDLYRWNKNASNYNADNAGWYFFGPPSHGTVFTAELLGNSGLLDGYKNPHAGNSSLDLETCIFKVSDLPTATDSEGSNLDKSKAIWCTTWDHKFHYDFSSGKVVQGKTTHPFCAEPNDGPF